MIKTVHVDLAALPSMAREELVKLVEELVIEIKARREANKKLAAYANSVSASLNYYTLGDKAHGTNHEKHELGDAEKAILSMLGVKDPTKAKKPPA